ncbi:diguanylate cyclase [Oscillatoria sp. FACHB-1406]|nr:diguanylate cyclase [Oscillatoria sp. FACHB-1406]
MQLYCQDLMQKKWLKRLDPRRSLKKRLGLAIATTTLLFSLLLSWIVGNTSKTQIKADSSRFVEQLAYQMSRNLDRDMFVHYQEIRMLSTLEVIRDSRHFLTSKRALLNRLQKAYKNYAWIGLTNFEGVVVASTNQILEGKKVSSRPWFIQGKQGAVVEDVHEAKLLAPLLPNPNPNGEPLRFVDIAAPVFSTTNPNKVEGVLGAHLYWNWAKDVRDDLLKPLQDRYHVEAMILSQSGEVLLTPAVDSGSQKKQFEPGWFPSISHLKSVRAVRDGERGFLVERWPDGTYLTGFAATQGLEDYPGLGWIVLVRQSTEEAFIKASVLQQQIILWGITLGIASSALAWWIAEQFLNPVLAIAIAAHRIRRGDTNIHIPVFSGKDEIAKLSEAISGLFTNLEQQKRLLQIFNLELEQKIEERTLALQQANEELQRLTMVDGLTGVANRRCFDLHLTQEWQRAVREQLPLSLILMNVDYFKRYNDYYGHPAGDGCLQ